MTDYRAVPYDQGGRIDYAPAAPEKFPMVPELVLTAQQWAIARYGLGLDRMPDSDGDD